MRVIIYFFPFFLLNYFSNVFADTVKLKDGSIIHGEILSKHNSHLKLKTSFAANIKINWYEIKSIKSEKPMQVMLKNHQIIETQNIQMDHSAAEKSVTLNQQTTSENQSKTYPMSDVSFINPEPWRLGKQYKIKANTNVSIKSQHGNTLKDEFELDGVIEFRGIKDRYTLSGKWERDNSADEKVADNWSIDGKYDYFVSDKRYFGIELSFERDEFTDLRRRTILGPYVGHQFYESKALNLKTELGISKVYEDYFVADDIDYTAMNWHVKYGQYFFKETIQFYHEHKGDWGIEKSHKLTIDSKTGFKFPLSAGFVASAELAFDYDSKPKPGIHKTDTTYRLKLGYHW